MKNEKIKNALLLIGAITAALVILGVVGVMLYGKIINRLEITIDTTALLSILLAFFSIWISVKFYMDAKDTSNAFYQKSDDHVTRQVEQLTRMEGTLKLLSRVQDDINTADSNLEDALEERNIVVDELKSKIDLSVQENKDLINELGERNKLVNNLRFTMKELYSDANDIVRGSYEMDKVERKNILYSYIYQALKNYNFNIDMDTENNIKKSVHGINERERRENQSTLYKKIKNDDNVKSKEELRKILRNAFVMLDGITLNSVKQRRGWIKGMMQDE